VPALGIVTAYYVLMGAWISAVDNEHDGYWMLLSGLVLQFVLGYALGRWWAPLLLIGVVALSVPAGTPDVTDGSERLPLWFGMIYAAAVVVPVVLAGVLVRKIYERRTRSRSADLTI
jgi:uncharacterized membrane protein YhdT